MSITMSAVFPFRDTLIEAMRRLRDNGIEVRDVMTPVPDHEILDEVRHPETHVGLFTLAGGIFGVLLGFLGASWCHGVYGLIVGGKPVVSVPPFIIVAFEMLILFGGLMTFAGIIVLSRLPKITPDPHYDPRASEDHYVLIVETSADKADLARDILSAAGGEVRQ